MWPIVPATREVAAVGAQIKCAVGAVETLTIGLDRKPEVAGRLAMICGRIGTHPRANLVLDDVLAVRNCRECRRLRRSGALLGQALVDPATSRHCRDLADIGSGSGRESVVSHAQRMAG